MKHESNSSDALIRDFFTELERLSEEYEELTDTDVRENIHHTLNYFFIWNNQRDQLPCYYSMFSLEGDRAVAHTVEKFLTAADECAEIINTPLGQARLNLLQNRNLKTPKGEEYDLFIGHTDEPLPPEPLPEYMFHEGEYDNYQA